MKTAGIPVVIDWGSFKLGTSFFIPGPDPRALRQAVQAEAQWFKIRVAVRAVVEQGLMGVRVWRLP